MNQQIEIADLVKPKFQPGQSVFVMWRDGGKVRSITPATIESVEFKVTFKRQNSTFGSGGPKVERSARLLYFAHGFSQGVIEHDVFASLDDVPEEYRKP